jgi:hypothetical protein
VHITVNSRLTECGDCAGKRDEPTYISTVVGCDRFVTMEEGKTSAK